MKKTIFIFSRTLGTNEQRARNISYQQHRYDKLTPISNFIPMSPTKTFNIDILTEYELTRKVRILKYYLVESFNFFLQFFFLRFIFTYQFFLLQVTLMNCLLLFCLHFKYNSVLRREHRLVNCIYLIHSCIFYAYKLYYLLILDLLHYIKDILCTFSRDDFSKSS